MITKSGIPAIIASLTFLLLALLSDVAVAEGEQETPAQAGSVPTETEPPPADSAAAPETAPAPAQAEPAAADTKPSPAETKPRVTSFAVVPGPFYNPNIGLGINVMPLLMFHPSKSDTVSPPSLVMMTGLWAIKPPFDEDAGSRQSAFINAATRLYLDEDRWRVVVMSAYINLFQEFYGIGGDADYSDPLFDYRLEQVVLIGQVFRQVIWKGFYVGLLAGFIAFHTKTDDPEGQEVLDELGSGAAWRFSPNIGLLTQYDTRNNKYYPSDGVNLNVRFNGSFKEDESYGLIAPGFNQYFALMDADKLVLAYRVFGQFGFGNLPIAAYAHYGMRGTTLGYESGEYMDKMMLGLEAEIRWLVWWRVGLEGGLGIGKVFADFSNFPDQPWLPGVWASATYKILDAQDIRARMTFAYGGSGFMFYFGVGQNF